MYNFKNKKIKYNLRRRKTYILENEMFVACFLCDLDVLCTENNQKAVQLKYLTFHIYLNNSLQKLQSERAKLSC